MSSTPSVCFFVEQPISPLSSRCGLPFKNQVMTSQENLQIRRYHLFWQILQIRQEKTPNQAKKLFRRQQLLVEHLQVLLRLFYQIKMKTVQVISLGKLGSLHPELKSKVTILNVLLGNVKTVYINLFSKNFWAAATEVIFSRDDTYHAISNVTMVTQFVETLGSCRVFSISLF